MLFIHQTDNATLTNPVQNNNRSLYNIDFDCVTVDTIKNKKQKKQKETLANHHHYEQEEECLTNDLSRKLPRVRQAFKNLNFLNTHTHILYHFKNIRND